MEFIEELPKENCSILSEGEIKELLELLNCEEESQNFLENTSNNLVKKN